jgi:hypothetical protein
MSNKQCLFFITKADVENVFSEVESTFDVQYYLMGLFDKPEAVHYCSLLDDPNFGLASFGDWNHINRHLILSKNTKLNVRDVPQRKGGIKYAVDQMLNPKSLEIKLGEFIRKKRKLLLVEGLQLLP